jgi:hypothetical protein
MTTRLSCTLALALALHGAALIAADTLVIPAAGRFFDCEVRRGA